MLTAAGFGNYDRQDTTTPALVVVDVTWSFCGTNPNASLTEAVAEFPYACGSVAWDAVKHVRQLVDSARTHGIPIFFTRPVRGAESDDGGRSNRTVDEWQHDVLPDTGIRDGDPVIAKASPSAFNDTPLAGWLRGLGVDGVVVCGGVTSGCVRATVVDAFSLGLPVCVALDASFDRVTVSHEVSLLDMHLKYAQVLTSAEIAKEWT